MANVTVGKHNTVLLLGEAATNTHRKEIIYADRYKDVYRLFGDSQLTDAYEELKKGGAPYVFLMNCKQLYDYLDIGEILRETDFAYIVPLSVYLSDEFDDSKTERRISYIEYLMEQIGTNNESVFLVTDRHAKVYEDMDEFITNMNYITNNFRAKMIRPAVPENIVFVANNLYNYDISTLPLVSELCTKSLTDYPDKDFGPAYFYLDKWENIGDWAYFQNHTVRHTTVENLLNFAASGNPLKIVYISRIIKAMKRELDFEEFIGKRYTEYRRLMIQEYLDAYLAASDLIYDYQINSVKAYRNIEPMTIDIENSFDIWPKNCLEKISLTKEISVV